MWRSRARRLAIEWAFNLVLVLIGELVVQLTQWPRLWVLMSALTVGWSLRAVVEHRMIRRPAQDRSPTSSAGAPR